MKPARAERFSTALARETPGFTRIQLLAVIAIIAVILAVPLLLLRADGGRPPEATGSDRGLERGRSMAFPEYVAGACILLMGCGFLVFGLLGPRLLPSLVAVCIGSVVLMIICTPMFAWSQQERESLSAPMAWLSFLVVGWIWLAVAWSVGYLLGGVHRNFRRMPMPKFGPRTTPMSAQEKADRMAMRMSFRKDMQNR